MTAACLVQRAGRPEAAGVVISRQRPLVSMRSGSESVLRLLERSELLEGVQGAPFCLSLCRRLMSMCVSLSS